MPKLTPATWIPLSAAIAGIIMTIPIVRAVDSPQIELTSLRQRVVSIESRIDEIRQRQDIADARAEARWDRVLNDLSQIKQDLAKVGERLGIADGKSRTASAVRQ
jgi:parvulin-like peptidyl-prolyl isomerase